MSIANNPTRFSKAFGVDPKKLKRLGALDVTLALDTKLFIDPLLLGSSQHEAINTTATDLYKQHYETIIKLLKASKALDDPAWKAALKLIKSKEIAGTCIGYGAATIHGSAIGYATALRLTKIAAQIINLGVEDPDLFAAMALFEGGIGPDKISDMTTGIILPALAKFNDLILKKLSLKGEVFDINGCDYIFMRNPYEATPTPIILLPTDILRDLPIAADWDDVASAAYQNERLREQINKHVSEIWAAKTKRDKEELKRQALNNKAAFTTLLNAIKSVSRKAYDITQDPDGLVRWSEFADLYTDANPLKLKTTAINSLEDAYNIVLEIVKQFKHLIENCGLNKELYKPNRDPHRESTAQRLFFAVSYSYCKSNDIDLSPEIDTGNGKIDFKFSKGFKSRILVEVKLSTNSAVISGYQNQLEIYKASQETMKAVYLILDVGLLGTKLKRLTAIKNKALKEGEPLSDIEVIDGIIKPSASKRKSPR